MKMFKITVMCIVFLACLLFGACQSSEPVIDRIEPAQGFPGTVITIHGSGFTREGNDVEFVHENLTFNQDNTAYHQSLPSPDGQSITFTLPEYLASWAPSRHDAGEDIGLSIPTGEVQISILNKNGKSNSIYFTIEEADLNKNSFNLNGNNIENDSDEKFWSIVEFNKPTERWFNPGPLGYGISTGAIPAGSEVSIYLTPEDNMNIDEPLKIRAELSHREESWKLIEVLESSTTYLDKIETTNVLSATLPEKQGQYYLLTAEVMGDNDEVLDTLYAKIYVPMQGISAELTVDRRAYGLKDTVKFQVVNYGPTVLNFGRPFTVEAYEDRGWVELPLEMFFTMELIMLKPGETLEQTLNLQDFEEHFEEGRYRIIKQVSGEGTDVQEELSVEFEVK